MNWDAIGAVGEIVGAVTVVVSLFYVAAQIRQNTESVRMAAELDVSKLSAGWASLVVNNPELAEIWDKAADDPESLTNSEIRIFLWFAMELLLLYEGQYNLYLKGHITEETWHAKASLFLGLIKNPIVRQWWNTDLPPVSPQFRRYVDEHIDQTDLSWEYASVAKSIRPHS